MFLKFLLYISDFFLYKADMTAKEMYSYFLSDIKKENPHIISKYLYESQSVNPIKAKIIELDLKMYRKKGNSNNVRLSISDNISVSSLNNAKREIFSALETLVYLYYNVYFLF